MMKTKPMWWFITASQEAKRVCDMSNTHLDLVRKTVSKDTNRSFHGATGSEWITAIDNELIKRRIAHSIADKAISILSVKTSKSGNLKRVINTYLREETPRIR